MRSTAFLLLRLCLGCAGWVSLGCSESLPAHCWQDEDCPQACRNGRCVGFPLPGQAAACQIVPDFIIGRPGERMRFEVEVRDELEKPLVLADGITWAATAPQVSGGGEGRSATFTLADPGSARAVEARIASTTCHAQVTVLPRDVAPGQVRVLVTDELTGRPLREALVVASDAKGRITSSGETNELGVAHVLTTGKVSLTVFHQRYGYLTLTSYDTSTGTRDLSLPLRRNPLDQHGGVITSFTDLPESQSLIIGLSGLSQPALGLDVHARQISDPSKVLKEVEFLGGTYDLRLPSNMYLSLGATVLKGESLMPGAAGLCDKRLASIWDTEEAISSGTCGTRIAWTLIGKFPVTAFTDKEMWDSPFGPLQALLDNPTLLERFQSSVLWDVQFRLKDVNTEDLHYPNLSNTDHYTRMEHQLDSVPLNMHFSVKVPRVPSYHGFPLEDVFVSSVVDVPGQGMVLIGQGAASAQAGPSVPFVVDVHTAPPHHGLEGHRHLLLIQATSRKTLGASYASGTATSLLVERDFNPLSGQRLFLGDFLPVPEKARFNFLETSDELLEGREFRFLQEPRLPGATMLRVVFSDRFSHRWTVLLAADQAGQGFRLPVPPEPFTDRTRFGYPRNPRSELLVQALSLRNADGGVLGSAAMAEGAAPGLARLTDAVRAISQLNYDRPQITWIIPSVVEFTTGDIDHGQRVRVRVSDFRVNNDPKDDGHVELTFKGGMDCEEHVLYEDVPPTLEQGEVEFDLPGDCHGEEVQLIATLVDASRVPLNPEVSSTVVVNIH